MAAANDGLMVLRPAAAGPTRTIIVSGQARSGTSMIAAMLHAAGLHLGTELDPVVREDHEVARALGTDGLAALVAARNRQHAVWGFKRPDLHVFGPEVIRMFRHPRLILTSRDPVAIARRDFLSEHRTAEFANAQVEAAAHEGLAFLRFAAAASCPVLLVSYEKALQDPGRLAGALLRFTGLPAEPAALARAVEPNRPDYLAGTERRYRGHIDAVRDNVVHGWAADIKSPAPLPLELLIDGRICARFTADAFRPDLLKHGIGDGYHGFKQALPGQTRRLAKLGVRVAGRRYELAGSGKALKAWAMPG